MIKAHIRTFWGRMEATLMAAPVESFLAIFWAVYGCLVVTDCVERDANILLALPGFTLAYLLGRHVPQGRWRWLYYALPLLTLALVGVDIERWIEEPWFRTLLGLCPFLLLLGRCRATNAGFVSDGLNVFKNLVLAELLVWVANGLLAGIYLSTLYIFDLSDRDFDEVPGCLTMLLNVGVAPILWMAFDRAQGDEVEPDRFFDTLVNWVVTPALLIYTAILCLYFLKIAVLWELPEGGIAWMVFAFVGLASLAKAYLRVGETRFAGWFYRYFHWICLPALAMFWIGVGRRVADYGLTEARVYLIACGVVMSWTALMFFGRRVASYRWAMMGTVLLFALLAVPGITAEGIAERAHAPRVDKEVITDKKIE